jgi:hypothetical protein
VEQGREIDAERAAGFSRPVEEPMGAIVFSTTGLQILSKTEFSPGEAAI